jgi:hypothetical protein
MRFALLTMITLAFTGFSAAQSQDKDADTEMIKAAVGQIAGHRKPKAEIVLRDLREFNGKIVAVLHDHFLIALGQKKSRTSVTIITFPRPKLRQPIRIFYEDVLQIEGRGIAMSVAPDPKRSPFATWDAVTKIGAGEFLQIQLKDGTNRLGIFSGASDDSVTLLRGNTRAGISRENIVRVFRVTSDTGSPSAKLLRGSQKGTGISDDVFPILDPTAHAHPLVLAAGAAIGALIYLLPRGGTKRVLVYAK